MLKDIVNADHCDVVGNKAGNTYKSFIWMSMQVDKAGDRKSPLLDLSAQVVISTSLVQIQPYPFYYGSVSGIGNAADCNSVALWGIVGSSPT